MFSYTVTPASEAYLILADRNGVPRVRKFVSHLGSFPRFFDDAPYPYAHSRNDAPGERWNLLDKNFRVRAAGVRVVPPITHTDFHDFRLRPNGDYLFMSYNWSSRDFSFLTTEHGLQKKPLGSDSGRPCRSTDTGCEDWGTEVTRDSAIQMRTPGGTARLNWNSWGNMAIEDCLTHRFADDYAHINSFHWDNGDIIASFRGCNKVLSIDSATGAVEWRIGKSMWRRGVPAAPARRRLP